MSPRTRLRPVLGLVVALALILGPAGCRGATSPADDPRWIVIHPEPSDAILANPERGFVGNGGDIAVDTAELAAEAAEGFTLIRTYVNLEAYTDRDLDAGLLTGLARGFETARAHGVKLVLRFAYHDIEEDIPPAGVTEPPLDVLLGHIDQLAPVLAQHRGVIGFVEAGFVGAWGEWHQSANGHDREPARHRIRDRLLAAVPAERFVLWRHPGHLRDWYGEPWPTAAAFSGDDQARLGIHNDCFLAGNFDANTYPADDEELRAFVRATVGVAPFGGETCAEAPEGARTDCVDILTEGREYGVNHLNWRYYRPTFHDRWEEQGCLDEVARSLGYRFVLDEVGHDAEVGAGQGFTVRLVVRNLGWARLYARRPLEVRLIHRETGHQVHLELADQDPRAWLPSPPHDETAVATVAGGTAVGGTVVQSTVTIPVDTPPGTYAVALALPDPDPLLASDGRYAIRFAVTDREGGPQWRAEDGTLVLGTVVDITPTH